LYFLLDIQGKKKILIFGHLVVFWFGTFSQWFLEPLGVLFMKTLKEE